MATKEKAISPGGSKSSKSKNSGSLVPPELFQASVYKRNQGRMVRLVTAVTVGVIIALSAWRLYQTLAFSSPGLQWAVPGVLLFLGWWLCYRLIHIPKFADFLIAVEAEMTKAGILLRPVSIENREPTPEQEAEILEVVNEERQAYAAERHP